MLHRSCGTRRCNLQAGWMGMWLMSWHSLLDCGGLMDLFHPLESFIAPVNLSLRIGLRQEAMLEQGNHARRIPWGHKGGPGDMLLARSWGPGSALVSLGVTVQAALLESVGCRNRMVRVVILQFLISFRVGVRPEIIPTRKRFMGTRMFFPVFWLSACLVWLVLAGVTFVDSSR